ncbi:MAG: acetyl-CoA carboxylase biotin carboxyl carrier protein [Saprospiraceae bacterium]
MMDFNQIQELIRLVSRSKLAEFELREGDFRLVIRNTHPHQETPAPQVLIPAAAPSAQPAPAVAAPPPAPAAPASTAPAPQPAAEAPAGNLVAIKSPMVGTFYRSPSPEKPPFVKVGDHVDKGMAVCIIEAMKLFNEVESDIKGKIVKILVEDASPVEYDQPLFLVEPA